MAITGSGTQADPYIISSASDLQELSGEGHSTYGVDKYYELGADIDMSGVSFTPIGTYSIRFRGHFDGKNHTISNLYINSESSSVGLFSRCYNCEIKNIVINNAYVLGSSYVSFICGGYSPENVTIDNCHVINSILKASSYGVGGIIAMMWTNCTVTNCGIINCYIKSSDNYVGGIGGYGAVSSTYQNCSVRKSTITGYEKVGGISGVNVGTPTISNCIVDSCAIIGTISVSGVCT